MVITTPSTVLHAGRFPVSEAWPVIVIYNAVRVTALHAGVSFGSYIWRQSGFVHEGNTEYQPSYLHPREIPPLQSGLSRTNVYRSGHSTPAVYCDKYALCINILSVGIWSFRQRGFMFIEIPRSPKKWWNNSLCAGWKEKFSSSDVGYWHGLTRGIPKSWGCLGAIHNRKWVLLNIERPIFCSHSNAAPGIARVS